MGWSGTSSMSSSPARIFFTKAACSNKSSRVVAKRRPLGMAPRQWPARPTRCMATATARVLAIWQTRSMSPMSIPSSSEAVATRILISPDFRRCSASRRSSRESEPWWAATCSSPRRPLSSKAIFSTSLRVLTKTSVLRCELACAASLSKISDHMPFEVMEPSSSEGTSMAMSRTRRWPTWMMLAAVLFGAQPVRNWATSAMGFCVAEMPMRCGRVWGFWG